MDNKFSVLNNKAIKKFLDIGEIVIYPFNEKHLNSSSYDVTLGKFFFREQEPKNKWSNNIYNINSKDHVAKVWGDSIEAIPYKYYKNKDIFLENIKDHEKIIWINPHETILAHTQEFVGGRTRVTSMVKCRSSLGRNFIETCKCSGWCDIGYINRITLEITNNSTYYKIPLIVGRRISQIIYMDTGNKVEKNKLYHSTGKYQTTSNFDEMIKTWNPAMMLPKMYKDYENDK